MAYTLSILPGAAKELRKLPKHIGLSINKKINLLLVDPRPNGYRKLTKFSTPRTQLEPLYRMRVGDYRVVYSIQEEEITITVVKIAHRKEVY